MGKRLGVAIYDAPNKVSRKIATTLSKAGHTVLFEGPLNLDTARKDADVWITKWSFNLKGGFFIKVHPKRALVTMSVGTDHIDKGPLRELGITLKTCPKSCSNSVAEHAWALALRPLFRESVLPPLSLELHRQ